AGRCPVIPGVVATATHDAVAQAAQYEQLGVAGVVAIRQPGLPTSPEGVESFYRDIAAAVSVPVVLYTNPGLLGVDLSIATIRRLADVANITAIKDASGNTGRILSVLTRTDLDVFSASAHIPAVVMRLGGVGWMGGPASAVPAASVLLYDLCRAGQWNDAFALQRVLWPLHEVFLEHSLAAVVKHAVGRRGIDVGGPIAPQTSLPAEVGRAIDAALATIDEFVDRFTVAAPPSPPPPSARPTRPARPTRSIS
ncbi:MAG TPA: dihydrodipicolinate synthase family protein, partial [Ilumatobacteraceae bacterium]|nr:dihydrodipicolinate synthase family protein [Ilumatobacteraceae bacterium]